MLADTLSRLINLKLTELNHMRKKAVNMDTLCLNSCKKYLLKVVNIIPYHLVVFLTLMLKMTMLYKIKMLKIQKFYCCSAPRN